MQEQYTLNLQVPAIIGQNVYIDYIIQLQQFFSVSIIDWSICLIE